MLLSPSALPSSLSRVSDQTTFKHFVELHCLDCHNNSEMSAGLALDHLLEAEIGRNQPVWEKVARKLTERQMPPRDVPRPDKEEYAAAIAWLETSLEHTGRGIARSGGERQAGAGLKCTNSKFGACWPTTSRKRSSLALQTSGFIFAI